MIVGVKMGGKDVVYVNQQYSSPLQPADIQKKLKDVADKRFTDASRPSSTHNDKVYIREMVSSKAYCPVRHIFQCAFLGFLNCIYPCM